MRLIYKLLIIIVKGILASFAKSPSAKGALESPTPASPAAVFRDSPCWNWNGKLDPYGAVRFVQHAFTYGLDPRLPAILIVRSMRGGSNELVSRRTRSANWVRTVGGVIPGWIEGKGSVKYFSFFLLEFLS